MKIKPSPSPSPKTQPQFNPNKAARNQLTPEQRDLSQKTGIKESRFDTAFWAAGQKGGGARPPDKAIWDSWTPQQRADAGFPTFTEWKAAAVEWRNGITTHRAQKDLEIFEVAKAKGFDLNSEGGFKKAMNAAGIFDRPDEGQAGFRRRMMQFRGEMDPSGRYHFLPDGRSVDVATSDLSKRGVPAFHSDAVRATGIQAALPGVFMQMEIMNRWAGQNLNRVGPDAESKILRDGQGLYVREQGRRIALDELGRYQDGSGRIYAQHRAGVHDVFEQAAGNVRFGGGGPSLG